MTKKIYGLLMVLMLVSSAHVQAITEEEAEAQCKVYAEEEKVTAEEMADYMAECVKDLTNIKE